MNPVYNKTQIILSAKEPLDTNVLWLHEVPESDAIPILKIFNAGAWFPMQGIQGGIVNNTITFAGIAFPTTNPLVDAQTNGRAFPGLYLAQEFGDYPYFGINVTNAEIFNKVVLLVPNITKTGLYVDYSKVIYTLNTNNNSYKYSSDIPRLVWEINHKLNKKPNVIITDTAGTLYEGAIFYNDDNNLTITFSAPFNGYADLN